MIDIRVVNENDLTSQQKLDFSVLQNLCFSHVDSLEAEECFYAKSFCRIFAYDSGMMVSMLRLIKRNIVFDNMDLTLGGLAGACVHSDLRRRGIGSKMMREGLQVLRDERVDVACLNADLSRDADKFYETLGFTLMYRPISFEDVHGNLRYDTGTMFIPVCSEATYNHIMNSKNTFHYGRGYW